MKSNDFWKRIGRQFVPNAGTIVIVVLLLLAQQAGALDFLASPASTSTTTISYQGRLADSVGDPVNDTVGMTFCIYNVSTGGSPLWTETYAGVPVSDGLFHVLLGSTTPLPDSIFADNDSLYLGITVGADAEMTPREQLASAPWAMGVPDGSIGSSKLNLDHGTACLSSHAQINLPGGQYIDVPGLSLDFSLDRPSIVLVWIDGLALYEGGGEGNLHLSVDGGVEKTGDFYEEHDSWFNVNGQRLVALGSGAHSVVAKAGATGQGAMTVHGSSTGMYRTCINYLVLGEQ